MKEKCPSLLFYLCLSFFLSDGGHVDGQVVTRGAPGPDPRGSSSSAGYNLTSHLSAAGGRERD